LSKNHKTYTAILAAAGLFAVGITAVSVFASPDFNKRWDESAKTFDTTVQDPVLYEGLHARALEILRERTVAKDEATNDDALSHKACAPNACD